MQVIYICSRAEITTKPFAFAPFKKRRNTDDQTTARDTPGAPITTGGDSLCPGALTWISVLWAGSRSCHDERQGAGGYNDCHEDAALGTPADTGRLEDHSGTDRPADQQTSRPGDQQTSGGSGGGERCRAAPAETAADTRVTPAGSGEPSLESASPVRNRAASRPPPLLLPLPTGWRPHSLDGAASLPLCTAVRASAWMYVYYIYLHPCIWPECVSTHYSLSVST